MGLTLLVIDSAGGACSVALWRDGAAVATRRLVTDRGHAQHLAPLVAAVLGEGGRDELDAVVATTGPGSFTGLRVGLALAHGVALASGVPALGISSFAVHAAAAQAAAGQALLVAIDSRRDELFLQGFGDDLAGEPFAATPAAIAERLRGRSERPIAIAGDAARQLAEALSDAGVAAEIRADGPADAAVAAMVAAGLLAAGGQLPPARPVYLRAPDVTISVGA